MSANRIERDKRFLLSCLMHLISGLVNGSSATVIIARSGTYFLLAFLVLSIAWLVKGNMKLLAAMLFGYCFSYIFILLVGTSTSPAYHLMPWRLGLGYAATMALALLFVFQRRLLRLAPFFFLVMAGIHIFMGSRNLGFIALIVAALSLIAVFLNRRRPARIRLISMATVIVVLLMVGWAGLQMLVYAAGNAWLSEELNERVLLQASHSMGFWVAARPDTYVGIVAITQRPLLGFGPGIVDPVLYDLYAAAAAESLVGSSSSYDNILQNILDYEWSLGTPSHSHLFGSWADAGILAAICWIMLLGLAIYVLARSIGLHNNWAPLYVFISISLMWDIVFSPGPHRMDIALRLIVLIFAVRHFRLLETAPRQDGKHASVALGSGRCAL